MKAGAGGAGTALRSAMLRRPRFQPINFQPEASRAAEQVLHCFSGLRANFERQKNPKELAAARRLSPRPETGPESLAAARRHSGAMPRVTRAAAAARVTHGDPSHSPGRALPAVTRSGQPGSLAPARVTRRGSGPPSITLALVTRSGPPSLVAARRHPPRADGAVTVVTRRGPPSLAAARLTDSESETRRSGGAKPKSASSFGYGKP